MHQIRGATLGDGGHAAFASILWSPPLKISPSTRLSESADNRKQKEDFQDCLAQVSCDVLLVFGKDDPWVSFFFNEEPFLISLPYLVVILRVFICFPN
jgi:hypothetical protein